MTNCEFCKISFNPRPQVKKPRACPKKTCQRARQRSNEKEWRYRNLNLYDSKYHRIKRSQRKSKLNEIGELAKRCMEVGKTFLEIDFDLNELHRLFEKFIFSLGIRLVNKFWKDSLP